jgi:hypothetical protein
MNIVSINTKTLIIGNIKNAFIVLYY